MRFLCQQTKDLFHGAAELHKDIGALMQELQTVEDEFEKKNSALHNKVEQSYLELSNELVDRKTLLETEKKKFYRERELIQGILHIITVT